MIYIVRHAWAEDRDERNWPDDRDRPLTEKGRERFAHVAKLLCERKFAPELIATSPLVRCRQTADILARFVAGEPSVVERDELAPDNELEGLLAWTTREAKHADKVAWVGHAPGVDEMAAALIGDSRAQFRFSKGAAAAIEFGAEPRRGQGTLRWLVTAKMLGC